MRKLVYDKLKSKNATFIKNPITSFVNQSIVSTVLSLLFEEPFKYNIVQTGIFDYYLTPLEENLPPNDNLKTNLTSIASSEIIPTTKTIVCYETLENITFTESASNATKDIENFKILKLGTTVTLSVDEYFQPKVNIQKEINKSISAIIICLNETTFSVEKIKNGKLKKTEYNNIPFAIAFVDGRISIGKEALNFKQEYNSFIITDLLKFMKKEASGINVNPSYGFKIFRDKNDEIFLEFDTFRGRRKASPSFLFAFILRWIIKSAELSHGEIFKTLILQHKFIDGTFKEELQKAADQAKLSIDDIQIQRYKIVEIKNNKIQ
uniref:Uncharacterized protein n=1 Tax=Panagrolaimus sp. ES5 TaxID=591445 RepID=A0AC34FGS0_9BILA